MGGEREVDGGGGRGGGRKRRRGRRGRGRNGGVLSEGESGKWVKLMGGWG